MERNIGTIPNPGGPSTYTDCIVLSSWIKIWKPTYNLEAVPSSLLEPSSPCDWLEYLVLILIQTQTHEMKDQ